MLQELVRRHSNFVRWLLSKDKLVPFCRLKKVCQSSYLFPCYTYIMHILYVCVCVCVCVCVYTCVHTCMCYLVALMHVEGTSVKINVHEKFSKHNSIGLSPSKQFIYKTSKFLFSNKLKKKATSSKPHRLQAAHPCETPSIHHAR